MLAWIHSSGSVIIWNASRGYSYSNSDEFVAQITFDNSKKLIVDAENFLRQNDLNAALRVLDQLLKADGDYVDALILRGKTFYNLSRFTLAIADYARITEINPQHQIAWNWLGVSQTRLGQFDEAIHSLSAAYDANPQTGNAPRAHRAVAYIQRGDDEKGQSELKLISDSNPTSFASTLLASLYVSHGDLDSYRELCKRMDHSNANITRVVWACVLGPNAVADYAPLIETAQKLQNKSPTDLNNAENYGAILFRAGRFEEAMQQFVESCGREVTPMNMNLSWYLRAMTHKQLKQESEAIEWLEKADAAADALFARGYLVDWVDRSDAKIFQKEARELIRGTNN